MAREWIEPRKPADPAGFEAHIALRDDLNSEIVHPAGTWFFPPSSGEFLGWIENPARSWISPSPTPLLQRSVRWRHARHGSRGSRRAGRPRAARLADMRGGHCTLGLLYANSQISPESFIRPEMKRLAPESMAVAQGALMPTGAVAALLYDKELKEYRAVEAPLAVAAGHTADLHLKPPGQGSSDLVVVLLRPKVIAQTTEEEAMPRLVLASGKGRYRIVLARPRGYVVMVQFPDRGRPYLVIIDVQGTGRPDLEVPGNDFRVRVVRGDTGAPIPKADVGVNNETGRVRAQEAGGGAGAPDHIVGAYTRQSNQPSSTSEPPSHSPAP